MTSKTKNKKDQKNTWILIYISNPQAVFGKEHVSEIDKIYGRQMYFIN